MTESKVEFVQEWGLFCRRAILDKFQERVSVIDILPELRQSMQIPSEALGSMGLLVAGDIAAAFCFRQTAESPVRHSETLFGVLVCQGLFHAENPVNISFDGTSPFSNVLITFPNAELVVPLKAGQGRVVYSFSLNRANGEQVGSTLLPVVVDITAGASADE